MLIFLKIKGSLPTSIWRVEESLGYTIAGWETSQCGARFYRIKSDTNFNWNNPHKKVWSEGSGRCGPKPNLCEVRERVVTSLKTLRPDHARSLNPCPYKVISELIPNYADQLDNLECLWQCHWAGVGLWGAVHLCSCPLDAERPHWGTLVKCLGIHCFIQGSEKFSKSVYIWAKYVLWCD